MAGTDNVERPDADPRQLEQLEDDAGDDYGTTDDSDAGILPRREFFD